MQSQPLIGKVAVITGAGRGIGAAIARRLATEGAVVIVADIDIEAAREVAGSIGVQQAFAQEVDIASSPAVSELADHVQAQFGRCDILVNNAAILDMTGFGGLTMARMREVIEVNLLGAVQCALKLGPMMQRSGWGRIVNIASIMGLRGSRNSIPYSTAKAGLVNLTRCLACDLAEYGILVNAIAPGFIDTRMALLPDGSGHEHETEWFQEVYMKHGRLPLKRAGVPEDVAAAAYFLCSEDCRYMTGQVLMVDGGVSATF